MVPLLDCDATIAPTINTAQSAAAARRRRLADRSASDTASGMTATMFNARSLGFLNMPPTAPITRPFSTMLIPRPASTTARNAMYPDAITISQTNCSSRLREVSVFTIKMKIRMIFE